MNYKYNISIIIPCYNCSKFVDETMQSLMKQTYDFNKMEILLINDGSKDDTLSIIKKYESQNVIVVDKENEGVSATRNLGIQMARGKYILFLDPDDYLSKNSIQNIISFFDQHYDEIDMITYPMMLFYHNGRKHMHARYKKDFHNKSGIFDLNEHYLLVQATINVCIKNNKQYAFDIHQYYSEDEQFNTKILMEKKKIGYVANARYYYRQHKGSITAHKKDFDFEKVYTFHKTFQDVYQNHPYIQSIIINNLRWRSNEDCLYPKNLESKKIDKYLEPITERLSKIDFSLYKEYLNERLLLKLLSLSKQRCVVKKNLKDYSLICNNKVIFDKISSNHYIYSYQLNGNELKLFGRVDTALYYLKDIHFMVKFYYRDHHTVLQEIPLTYKISSFKNYEREYELSIDLKEIKKLEFYLTSKNFSKILLHTEPEEWCSKSKVLEKYHMKIDDGIIFHRALPFQRVFHKFPFSKNMGFHAVNLLSILDFKDKNKTLYFGDKNSKIYDIYRSDHNPKVFVEYPSGLHYKLLLLSCKKIVTDKSMKEVIPFGSAAKKYVSASRFIIHKIGD